MRKFLLHDLLQLLSSVSCCYWIAAEDKLGHLWQNAFRRGLLLSISVFNCHILDRVTGEVEDLEMRQSSLGRVEVQAGQLILLQHYDFELGELAEAVLQIERTANFVVAEIDHLKVREGTQVPDLREQVGAENEGFEVH